MGLIKAIKRIFKKKIEVKELPIDPESIRQNHLVKALSYSHAEDQSTIANLRKELAEIREREKDKIEEENVKVILDEKKKELKLKSQGKVFSLTAFFIRYLKDKKFRSKLSIYSFDRKTKLGGFGDICIADNGDFVLLNDKGEMVLRMQVLKDLFQSVGALGYDVNAGMLPVWLDKDGGYIENIMEYEAPELLSTGEKLKFAKARKRPVYEIIQGLNNEISDLRGDLAESEKINLDLQMKVDKLESERNLHENMAETSRSELVANEEKVIGIDRIYRNVQRDMMKQQKLNEIQEDLLDKMEEIKNQLMKEAERAGSTTSFNDVISKIDSLKYLLKDKTVVMPQQTSLTQNK